LGDEDWKHLDEIKEILEVSVPTFDFPFTPYIGTSFVSGL
jgi:hypothetical protein